MKYLAFAIVILTLSCNKKEDPFFETINVSGYVYDQVGDVKIRLSNVSVTITYRSSPYTIPVIFMETDKTGKFNLTFSPEKSKNYTLEFYHNNDIEDNSNIYVPAYRSKNIILGLNKEYQYFEVELDSIRKK